MIEGLARAGATLDGITPDHRQRRLPAVEDVAVRPESAPTGDEAGVEAGDAPSDRTVRTTRGRATAATPSPSASSS